MRASAVIPLIVLSGSILPLVLPLARAPEPDRKAQTAAIGLLRPLSRSMRDRTPIALDLPVDVVAGQRTVLTQFVATVMPPSVNLRAVTVHEVRTMDGLFKGTLVSDGSAVELVLSDAATVVSLSVNGGSVSHRVQAFDTGMDGQFCQLTAEQDEQLLSATLPPGFAIGAAGDNAPRRLRFAPVLSGALATDMNITLPQDSQALFDRACLLFAEASRVLQAELGIALDLVTYPDMMPTTNADHRLTSPAEVQSFLDNRKVVFDVGHFVGIGASGDVEGTACMAHFAARAMSMLPRFQSEFLPLLLHEIGHQLGARHTYNLADSGRSKHSAYEPGNGNSAMARHMTPHYHARSANDVFTRMAQTDWLLERDCGERAGNIASAPALSPGMDDVHVPLATPIVLRATVGPGFTSYRWDEYDQASAPGVRPPYYSSVPTRAPARTFPSMNAVLTEQYSEGDALIDAPGKLSFRVIGWTQDGVVAHKTIDVNVEGSGPFEVMSVACCSTASRTRALRVDWQVAATNTPPIDALSVAAWLSLNGGGAWISLATIPNTGNAILTLPAAVGATKTARLMLVAEPGAFFAVSQPFEIP